MTTQITVNAHCGDDKEVKISIKSDTDDEITLQDGESIDSLLVYDEREITIKEVLKKSQEIDGTDESESGVNDTEQPT